MLFVLAASTKSTSERKPWTSDEDETIRRLVDELGPRSWAKVADALPGRSGKQCRERWHNHLDIDIKKDPWSVEEDRTLVQMHERIGNKWVEIAKHLPARTMR